MNKTFKTNLQRYFKFNLIPAILLSTVGWISSKLIISDTASWGVWSCMFLMIIIPMSIQFFLDLMKVVEIKDTSVIKTQSNEPKGRPGFVNFNGDLDSLLEHSTKIDTDTILNDNTILNDEEAIALLISDIPQLDRKTAEKILFDIKMEQTESDLKSLMEKGYVEILRYNSLGEPVYVLTEKGKILGKQLNG